MIDIAAEKRFIHTNLLARQHISHRVRDARRYPLFSIGAGIFILCSVFVFLWVRICVLRTGYNISKALETQRILLRDNRALRLERAALSAAPRIEKIARNKLGMISPDNKQIIILQW